MPSRYQFFCVAIEERKKQSAYMRTVLIGIGENDNFMILKVFKLKILAYAGSEGGYDGAAFVIFKHLLNAPFFNIQRFAAQRQYCLEPSVTALLRAAACRIAFNDEKLVYLIIPARAA